MSDDRTTATSVVTIVAAVVVAALVAVAGSDGGARLGGVPVMVWCAVASFAVNWVVFIPAWLGRTERYFDLTGTLTYLVVVGLGLVAVGRYDARSVLLAVLVAVWTLRLGLFLFRRVLAAGSDARFDRIKTDPWQFLSTWTLQGLWCFLTAAAALGAITAAEATDPDVLVAVGAAIWLAGFAVEVVADRQKAAFRADPSNDGSFITTGLWAWSRHPNYFGELTLWVGVALVALGGLAGWRYVALVSPVFVFVLLRWISGVPLLERRADRRWGDRPDYVAYRDHTPVFFPRPPRGGTGAD